MADIPVTLKTGTTPYRIDTLRKLPAGNFGDNFNFSIQDSMGVAKDITGMTPKFTLFRAHPGRELEQAIQINCTIVSGAGGTCRYTVASGDFTERVIYTARIELYTGTTKIDSTQDFLVEII